VSEAEHVQTGKAMCPYCGVGCLMDIATKNNRIIELRGNPDSPVNQGLLCPKGALASPVLDLPGRLLSPQYRPTRSGEFVSLGWKDTFEKMAVRLRAIIDQYGPDS